MAKTSLFLFVGPSTQFDNFKTSVLKLEDTRSKSRSSEHLF